MQPCLCGDPFCDSCFPGAKQNEKLRESCVDKLSKVRCSHFFKCVLAHLLQDKEPEETGIEEICVTSDNFWMIRETGHIGFDRFVGDVSELYRNIRGIAEVAELTEDELEYLLNCVPTA